MFWQDAQLNSRFRTIIYLWVFCVFLALVWTFYGDIAHVKNISTQHWVKQNHHLLLMISDDSMYLFYLLFIGIALWTKVKKYLPFYYISSGYIIAQLLGSALLVRVIKVITGHARPEIIMHSSNLKASLWQNDVWIGFTLNPKYNGFPSGHTCDYFLSAIFLSFCLPKVWMRVLVFAFAAFNGFLRVALAKHFPLDVLGGVILAGLSAFIVCYYWIKPKLSV